MSGPRSSVVHGVQAMEDEPEQDALFYIEGPGERGCFGAPLWRPGRPTAVLQA